MKKLPLFSRVGFAPILALSILLTALWPARATVHVIYFTPYNCQLPIGYDTTVQCMDGDSLLIINSAPSQFPVNYFLERNQVILDTVSSVPGDTIWRWVISPSDSLLSIHVQSMPGSCYGQRYLLQRSSAVEEVIPLVRYSRAGRILSFTGVPLDGIFYLMNHLGQLLMEVSSDRTGTLSFQLPDSAPEWIILVMVAEGKSVRYKLSVPRE